MRRRSVTFTGETADLSDRERRPPPDFDGDMRVLIGNLAPESTDEELKAFLVKYGFPPFDEIERYPGDGSRPAALLRFNGTLCLDLEPFAARVRGVFWKGRTLEIDVLPMLGEPRPAPDTAGKHR